MTEITLADLVRTFFESQNVDNPHSDDDGNICFNVRKHDSNIDPKRIISKCDIEDVRRYFTCSLQSRPFAKHLLQVLWIREVIFKMGALKDEDVFTFICRALSLYGIDIDNETVDDELSELLSESYLKEDNSGISLASEGKRFAEGMFKTMKMLISNYVESPSLSTNNSQEISKLFVEVVDRLREHPIAVPPSTDTSDFSPLDETKGRWISQDEFLEKKNITRRTIGTYRNRGKKSGDGLMGKDEQGNHWRKYGTCANEKPEYFLLNDE